MILLYKGKGKKEDLNNYRGISLQAVTYKIFTKLLKTKTEDLVNNSLSDSQFGFRRERSTGQAIDRLLSWITEGGIRYGLFIDLCKAFDSVDRHKLLQKMQNEFSLPPSITGPVSSI